MAELVLVRPGVNQSVEAHWGKVPPLGLGYVAAAARSEGITVKVVDGKLERHRKVHETAQAVLAHTPSLVGVSAMTMEYPAAAKIAGLLKEAEPRITTILGGVHANAFPSQSLMESPVFDYLVAGEAESTLPRLIFSLREERNVDSICGVYARDGSGRVRGSPRQDFEDISQVSFPAWDLFPRSRAYPVMTERGCPYRCVFCSHNMGRRVRTRPLESVKEEIAWLYKNFKSREIYFEDETFGLAPERTLELLEWLAVFNQDKKIIFKAQTRVDKVSFEMLKLMKRAGFDYLELGVESGDAGVLKRSGKGITLTQAEEAVRLVRKAGLRPWVNFIIGLPGENVRTVRNTINFAIRLNPHKVSVALIVAYPGTKIYNWALEGERGYRLLSRDWSGFDKYIGRATVELESLSFRRMRQFQIRMYLETYLRNFRISELMRLIWEGRRLALG